MGKLSRWDILVQGKGAYTHFFTVLAIIIADPEIPADLIAVQIEDKRGDCFLKIAWNAPNNIDPSNVSYYIIDVDGKNMANQSSTDGKKINLLSYMVCGCSYNNVSVRAVSVCNRVSQSSTVNITTPSTNIMSCDSGTTEENVYTGSSNAGQECTCKSIQLILLVVIK